MVSEHRLSERRACRLVGHSRDSYRHPPQADQATQELHEKIVEIAHVCRRFGYQRIHDLLRPQFPGVNHKRVNCLYRQANLAVRRRKKGKRPSTNVYRCIWRARSVRAIRERQPLGWPAAEVPHLGR